MSDRQAELMAQLEQLRKRVVRQPEPEVNVVGFLGGAALGLIVGAALALFLSPKTGEQTREQLRDTSIELKDRATHLAGQAKEQAGTLGSQAQDTLGQVKDRAQTLTGSA